MAKDERFERVYTQGVVNTVEIWVDKKTGVNYMFRQSGYAGGITSAAMDGLAIAEAIAKKYSI